MRRSLKKLATTAGAALASVAFAVPAATAGAADPAWTVGPVSPETFSAVAYDPLFVMSGVPLSCTSSTMRGTLGSASGAENVQVGTITSLVWAGCTHPFGPVTPTAETLPWTLAANTYSAGVTTGHISGVRLRMSVLTCTATASGRLAVTYTNSTGKLAVSTDATRKLTVGTATAGCSGLMAVGSDWTYTATYSVVTPIGGTAAPSIVYTS
ncbi:MULTISPECIES: hypothetical protein [Streptomyces]|uniref:Tat pathway signal sequence domain protein n=1 Tax=Streptomyces glycanivorans TaxID=3033808 RepID=A0ABY9J520_9ACTN|nr:MULTISPECIES: hypothetical protein [unclassified Streptomyces]WSQ76281.1 hypothetical protein OG725_03885 [Streptomyces sp. NBC_01213]TXS13258.1 hypothetical protein EAO68_19135 [Streptomyces sp. wa22]WLQ62768.1 hypothetical protein P8A20_03790 [Streptomyces sp. Alt3]WSQ83528.1 hypothetical protein OG722_03840 [Streptomyces sp. NBC_01212]WSR10442.1 hypothetical protein OG265_32475 [Streptomyces sp. NBC_01208]